MERVELLASDFKETLAACARNAFYVSSKRIDKCPHCQDVDQGQLLCVRICSEE